MAKKKIIQKTKAAIALDVFKKAKYVTLITFCLMVVLSIIGLLIGIIFLPDPLIIVNGLGIISNYLFQYFLIISSGVALTGIGQKVAAEVVNMRNGKVVDNPDSTENETTI
jgi:hypothetical protein